MTRYTLKACEDMMEKYIEKGGEVVTLYEGCLGLGTVVCFGKNLKTTIIQERYLNEWSSYHTMRMYNKMPKKYEIMLEKIGY